MGGPGSGRTPDVVKSMQEQAKQLIAFMPDSSQIEIPNYSGLKQGTKLTDNSGWTSDGTNVYLTDSTDKVGMGTATAPSGLLDITGTVGTASFGTGGNDLTFSRAGANYVRATSATGHLYMGAGNIIDIFQIVGTGSPASTTMVLTGGKVGINTPQPASALHVSGSALTISTVAGTGLTLTSLTGTSAPRLTITPAGNFSTTFQNTGNGDTLFADSSGNQVFNITNSTKKIAIGNITSDTELTLSGAMSFTNTTAPTLTTTSGSQFVSGGALWYKGFAGTVTKLANS